MCILKVVVLISLFCLSALTFLAEGIAQETYPRINEVMSLNVSTIQDSDGDTPDWIEIFNSSEKTIQMRNYFLSDDSKEPQKWKFPNLELPAKEYLVIFASGKYDLNTTKYSTHTNFKINSNGEKIYFNHLTGPIDSINTGILRADISTGRTQENGEVWKLFNEPTPGSTNSSKSFNGYASAVSANIKAGFYSSSQHIVLTTNSAESIIRYSLNGATPSERSAIYSGALSINSTKVLKCRAFEKDMLPGPELVQSYFINLSKSLPVVSLSTDPDNLFDDDIGIYVEGNGTAYGGYPSNPVGPPANYWEDWERPVHIELFSPEGENQFSLAAGIKMFGKASRNLPQKSFALHTRSRYGSSQLDYGLFSGLNITSYKSFLLRNAGSDNMTGEGAVHFRDGFTATVASKLDIEKQAYQPAVVYINGEYWGIYGIREKNNEDFLAAHHGIDPDKVDILDDYHTLYPLVVEGSANHYNALLDYLEKNGTRDNEDAKYVSTQMNVGNFLDYMALQIYSVNHDGPGHNSKFWRPQSPEGKYRWILYDTDFSFSGRIFVPEVRFDPYAYEDNTIAYYRETDGPSWPNPPESTYMFRKIIENEGFRNSFINRSADLLNTIFKEGIVLHKLDSIYNILEPEIRSHTIRWGGSKSDWIDNVDVIRDFAKRRPDYLRDHIIHEFDLAGSAEISLHISPAGSGIVKLNTLILAEEHWNGVYFSDVPIELKALPKPGYKFTGWSEDLSQSSDQLAFSLSKNTSVTAQFEKINDNTAYIQINEISFLPSEEYSAGEWIELYNPYGSLVDVSNWTIKGNDDNIKFRIPPHTKLPPDGYLVITGDSKDFSNYYPDVQSRVGNLISEIEDNGESFRLFDLSGNLIDQVNFSASTPWPDLSNSSAKTIAFWNRAKDNNVAGNWAISVRHGTPGYKNEFSGTYTDLKKELIPDAPTILTQVFPNPFTDHITVQFHLDKAEHVQLKVYGLLGDELANLEDKVMPAGSNKLVWKGQSSLGLPLTNGIYFIRLIVGNDSYTHKVMMIR